MSYMKAYLEDIASSEIVSAKIAYVKGDKS